MNAQQLLDLVEQDHNAAYAGDTLRDKVVGDNFISFKAYHDDGDLVCHMDGVAAFLATMVNPTKHQLVNAFWTNVTQRRLEEQEE